MPGDRQNKYKPWNIEVLIKDVKDFTTFSSESELNNLLLKNIDLFMGGVFNETVKSATNKKSERIGIAKLKTGQLLPLRGVRLDLWVECESGHKYIIEIKNPKRTNYETINAIGQILGYAVKFPQATHLVIVSTVYDQGFLEIIERFNLPIDFVLVTEKSFYLLKKYGKS